MKGKTIAIYIGIGCLLTVLTCLSYFDTRKQMLKVAERALVEAVRQDLEMRERNSGEPISYHYGKEKPEYVHMQIMKDDGTDKSYALKDMDYSKNVDPDFYHRILHTIMVEMGHGICPDSLNLIWQRELLEEDIEARTAILVGDDGDDMTISCDSLSRSFEALPIYYAGAVNEIRLNTFVRFSFMDVFCRHYYTLVLLLVFIGWSVYVAWQTFLAKVPHKGCCQLGSGVFYDSNLGCFFKHRKRIKLLPKSNAIVKALLEAENHQLHGADLLAKVWGPNESNMNKLYIQNTKLRAVLKTLGDGFDIISVERSHFRFVYPNVSSCL